MKCVPSWRRACRARRGQSHCQRSPWPDRDVAMTRKQKWRIFAPLGVCALLGLWIALSAANARAASFSLVVYALANLIVYTDALDFALRLFMRRRRKATLIATADYRDVSIDLAGGGTWSSRPGVPMRPYAIIASVY